MAELPENLQIVKTEELPQLQETEAQPRRLIKERLNLHVKRRLQQEQQEPPQAQAKPQQIQIITHPSGNATRETLAVAVPQQSPQLANVNVNSTAHKVTAPPTSTSKKQKEPVKTRRPYQKRADKNTTKIQNQKQIAAEEDGGGRSRKTKRHKQQGTLVSMAVQSSAGNAWQNGAAGGALCLSPSVEEGSGGGGEEVDGRDIYSRDKEKCPDILGMVLSGKKRALIQNAEVQEFLGKIMTAFKN